MMNWTDPVGRFRGWCSVNQARRCQPTDCRPTLDDRLELRSARTSGQHRHWRDYRKDAPVGRPCPRPVWRNTLLARVRRVATARHLVALLGVAAKQKRSPAAGRRRSRHRATGRSHPITGRAAFSVDRTEALSLISDQRPPIHILRQVLPGWGQSGRYSPRSGSGSDPGTRCHSMRTSRASDGRSWP